MRRIIFAVLLAVFAAQIITAQEGPYRLAKEIPIAGDGAFDYLSVDPAAHRLFVSHGTKIVVVDTEHDKIEGEIPGVTGVHGLTLGRDLECGFSANGGENTVGIVDLSTLKILCWRRFRSGQAWMHLVTTLGRSLHSVQRAATQR